MGDLLDDYLDAKAEYENAKERLDKLTAEIANDMINHSIKSEIWSTTNRGDFNVTVVQSETMKFDENSLLKEMGKRAFSRIANLKLDKKKLEAAINDGTVDAGLVARNAIISRNTPYIRVTEYRGED